MPRDAQWLGNDKATFMQAHEYHQSRKRPKEKNKYPA